MKYELLTIKEVAKTLQLNASTIHRLVRAGQIPPPIKVGPSAIRWRSNELQRWLDARPRSINADKEIAA